MAVEPEHYAELIERLRRAGFVVGEVAVGDDGITRILTGDQWMTVQELTAIASQDSEVIDKP